MKNKIVLLRSGNVILRVLGQFRTQHQAEFFISENFPNFYYSLYQWQESDCSETDPNFITIEN